MKKVFLVLLLVLSCSTVANGLNAVNDPVMNPCIQRPYLAGHGINGSSTPQRVYKVPNHWGAIYVNPANTVAGYPENSTEGYRSANKEALVNCIKAGGGKNPIASDGKGCRRMTEARSSYNVVAIGSVVGSGGAGVESGDNLEKAEQEALAACSEYSNRCVIKYSDCSRHPDYRIG